MQDLANNTHYFKSFNKDYRLGGRFFDLSLSELRAIIILQANCDQKGIIANFNGTGYSVRELSEMIGLDRMTLSRALNGLEQKGLIHYEGKIIVLPFFAYEATHRTGTETPSQAHARRRTAVQMASMRTEISEIHKAVDAKSAIGIDSEGRPFSRDTGEVFEVDTNKIGGNGRGQKH